MAVTRTPLPTSRLLAGPALLIVGPIVLAVASTLMASASSSGSVWPLSTAVVGGVLAGLLLAWRVGMGWARWAAWLVAVLAFALSALMLVVGIWAAGYYNSPSSDLPLLVGLPPVVLIGSGLVLWTVIRRRTA